MTRRSSVRVLPLVLVAFSLAACSDDGDDPGAAPSETSQTTAPATPSPTAPNTVVTTTLDPAGKAACEELSAISNEISGAFTDGVGIDEGAVLDEQQIEAVRQLGERFATVEIADEGIRELRDDVVAATTAVLLQAAAGEALTAAVAEGLTGAVLQLGSLCESGV